MRKTSVEDQGITIDGCKELMTEKQSMHFEAY